MNDQPPAGVAQAIAAVIAEMPAIGKDTAAPGVPYKFRGIEALTAVIQPLLAKHGVIIVPQARSMEVKPSPGQKEAWQDVVIHFDWLVIGPDGSSFQASTFGIGRDHTDKGANKAQTQAYKYLLMHLLCISDPKDDGDSHSYDPYVAAADTRDDPNVEAANALYDLLAQHAKEPGVGAALKALGVEHGKRFDGQALQDPEWRQIVGSALSAVLARNEQDHAAESAPVADAGNQYTDEQADAARRAKLAKRKLAEAGMLDDTDAGTFSDPESPEYAAEHREPQVAWTTCGYEPSADERDAYLAETGKYVGAVCHLPHGHEGPHAYEEPF